MEIDYIEDSFVFDFHNSYQEKLRNRQRISQKAKTGAISKENVVPITSYHVPVSLRCSFNCSIPFSQQYSPQFPNILVQSKMSRTGKLVEKQDQK